MKHLDRDRVNRLVDLYGTGDRDALAEILRGYSSDALAELKALIWLGRDEEWPGHWDALVIEARAKVDESTPGRLTETPNLANVLVAGMERLEEAGRV